MLVQKKISNKKLAASLAVIIVMIAGTAIMLYANKRLTSPGGPTIVQTALIAEPSVNQVPKQPSQTINIDKLKKGGGLDLTIFNSEKFKQLKDSGFVVKQPAEVGKRDPFQPN